MAPPDLIAQAAAAAGRQGPPTSDYDLNPSRPAAAGLRAAAVLLPMIEIGGTAQIYLTKRASHLKSHPGQIALPGGKVDAGDAGPEAAALREASEEIGLPAGNVRILGRMAAHETVTGFSVTPVLGRVTAAFLPVPEAGEVEEVFTVPLSAVLDSGRYRIEGRFWRGEWRRYYCVPHGPYYIWGATARILKALADRMG